MLTAVAAAEQRTRSMSRTKAMAREPRSHYDRPVVRFLIDAISKAGMVARFATKESCGAAFTVIPIAANTSAIKRASSS